MSFLLGEVRGTAGEGSGAEVTSLESSFREMREQRGNNQGKAEELIVRDFVERLFRGHDLQKIGDSKQEVWEATSDDAYAPILRQLWLLDVHPGVVIQYDINGNVQFVFPSDLTIRPRIGNIALSNIEYAVFSLVVKDEDLSIVRSAMQVFTADPWSFYKGMEEYVNQKCSESSENVQKFLDYIYVSTLALYGPEKDRN